MLTPDDRSDNAMAIDTYKVVESAADTAFPTINIQQGTITKDAGNKKFDIGAASGYTNSNYPDPAVIDYQVKYKDTVGNFHFFPVRQSLVPTTVYPPIETAKFEIEVNFSDNHGGNLQKMKSTANPNIANASCLDFSGGYTNSSNASHLSIPDNSTSGLLDFGNGSTDVSFSFAFLFKADGGGSNDTRYIFAKSPSNGSSGYYCYYGEENTGTTSSRGRLAITLRDGTNIRRVYTAPTIDSKRFFSDSFDTFIHVGIVYNGSTVQFYKNGQTWGTAVSPATSGGTYTAMHDNSERFRIGTRGSSDSTGYRAKGRMANFIVLRHDGNAGRGTTPLSGNDMARFAYGGYARLYLSLIHI